MQGTRALLLNGSPRRENSLSLANHLADLLSQKGIQCSTAHTFRDSIDTLRSAMSEADLVVLSFPLYVDSLPGSLTEVLEQVAGQFTAENGQALAAIVNCGFPESGQAEVALGIVERFAAKTGFRWLGGLAMGAGSAMAGRSVSDCGGMVRNVAAGLALAADELAQGREISPEAVRLVGLPLFPHLLYRVMAGQQFRGQARKNGVKIYARPYEWRRRG